MRIYIAAFYQSRKTQALKGTVFARAASLADPAYNLESFHYIHKRPEIAALLREDKKTIFLDSGAFSMFTQNVEVDLRSYARFVYQNKDIIHVASNLDAIGRDKEQLSYDNQKQLETWLKPHGLAVQPVHHVRDKDEWLQRYLDEGYDYIFLGGMVPENTPHLKEWLDHVWDRYLTDDEGRPKVKVHGFGLTTLDLMFRYPWYSVDSTSWVMTAMFGAVYVDVLQPDGTVRDYKVDFSSKSKKQQDHDSWHITQLDEYTQSAVIKRVEELESLRPKNPELEKEMEASGGFKQGYNPEALALSYGWRDHFNIAYFKRAQQRGVDFFKRKQLTLLM